MANCDEILKKIADGEYKLLEKTGRSIIWACFTEILKEDGSILKDKVYCRVCRRLFKFSKGQTSNLVKHKCVHAQPNDNVPVQVNTEDKNACFEAFMDFAIGDCRPFSIVEGSGYRKMISKCIQMGAKYGENVDLDHLIPSRRMLARKAKLMAEEKKQEITPHIQNLIANSEASITINMWTDDLIKRNFLCATLHFHANFRLVDITLGIKSMDVTSNTAVNIREKLNSLFEEFGLTDVSNAVFVTEHEKNTVGALKDVVRLNCSAHIFSSVLNDAFDSTDELKDITKACKHFFKYFKNSNNPHILDTTFKTHCLARWNSNFAMFKSILYNYSQLNEILADNTEKLSMLNVSISVLQRLVEICNDFDTIFEQLQASASPTLCFVIPSINKVKTLCATKNNEDVAIAALKINILSHLEKWSSSLSLLHKAALFLYPPAKSLQLNEINDIKEFCITKLSENRTEVGSDSFNLSSNFGNTTSHPDAYTPAVSGSPKRTISPELLEPLSPIMSSSASECTSEPSTTNVSFFFPSLINEANGSSLETGRDEVERYCSENVRLTDEFDVMLWWKNNSGKYPKLSKLATKILTIPASSVASERVLSLAGNIVTEKRNRLEPKTVDSMLFLNSLYKKDFY